MLKLANPQGSVGQQRVGLEVSQAIARAVKLANVDVVALLGRWERALSLSSDMSLQLYVDHVERNEALGGQTYDVFDVEFDPRVDSPGTTQSAHRNRHPGGQCHERNQREY